MGKDDKKSVQIFFQESKVLYEMPNGVIVNDILKKACERLGIYEIWWFGFMGVNVKGFNIWLNHEKKFISQELKCGKDGVYVIHFNVKYFPIDYKSEILQSTTMKIYYKHLREAIMNEELYCDPATAVSLASLHFQYSIGDISRTKECHNVVKKNLNKVIPAGVMKRHNMSIDEWTTVIAEMWQTNSMLEALMEALKVIQDLDMHGVRYYEIKNARGTLLYVGVESGGINIYKKDNKLIPKVGLSWSEIRSIAYIDKKFIIKPLEKNAPDFVMYSDNLKENQIIMHICIGNHKLFMSKRSREESDEVRMLRAKAVEEKQKEEAKKKSDIEEQERKFAYEEEMKRLEVLAVTKDKTNEEQQKKLKEVEAKYQQSLKDMEEKLKRIEMESNAAAQNRIDAEKALAQLDAKERDEMLEKTRQELELFKKKHDDDKARIAELEKQQKKGEVVKVEIVQQPDFKKMKQEREKTSVAKMTKVGTLLKQKNTTQTEFDQNHEEIVKSGGSKYKTLKSIRSGNTRARIDEFEAF